MFESTRIIRATIARMVKKEIQSAVGGFEFLKYAQGTID